MADENEEVAKTEEGAEKAGGEAVKGGGGKSSMIIIIAVALLVVIVTPLATFLVIKKMAPAPVVNVEQEKVNIGEQKIIALKAVIVNIAETKGTRILRMEPHLVVSEARLAEQMEAIKPLLTDRVILAAGRKTIDDLEGAQGREALKREIISEINAAIKDRMAGSVVDVYFSEFLIQ